MIYRVAFDKIMESGALEGITIREQSFTVPTWADGAMKVRRMRNHATGKDCMTGNRFRYKNIRLESVWPDGSTRIELTDEAAA